MPIRMRKEWKYRNEEIFVVETKYEKRVLEDARNFCGGAASLLIEGLGHNLTSKGASSRFRTMVNGYKNGSGGKIPVEDWGKIKVFASKYRKGEIDPSIERLKI